MNNEFELPDEIWKYILDFTLDWKRSHKKKMKYVLESPYLLKCYYEKYQRWTYFPPWKNTNDIIRDEYLHRANLSNYIPESNLPLTSITWNPTGSGGWWCGYGWVKRINV
jgi:hypothetical protein